jgi:hypothetical protein
MLSEEGAPSEALPRGRNSGRVQNTHAPSVAGPRAVRATNKSPFHLNRGKSVVKFRTFCDFGALGQRKEELRCHEDVAAAAAFHKKLKVRKGGTHTHYGRVWSRIPDGHTVQLEGVTARKGRRLIV